MLPAAAHSRLAALLGPLPAALADEATDFDRPAIPYVYPADTVTLYMHYFFPNFLYIFSY